MTESTRSRSAQTDLVARFFHLEKFPLFHRAGVPADDLDAIESHLAQASVSDLRAAREQLASSVDRAARDLLDDPKFAHAAHRLPFADGDVIIALGDSITDDSLSWAHLLARVVAEVRPGVRVLNHGITGHTTGEVLQRLDIVAAAAPHWIIQLVGTNDARRHGPTRERTVSLTETERNLAVIASFSTEHLGARHVAMTPPPTLDERVETWEPFALESISWRAADVAEVARAVRGVHPSAIELHSTFLRRGEHALLEPDGVHPNAEGQKVIVRTLVGALSASPDSTTQLTERSS